MCTSSSHAGCIAAARGGLGTTVRQQYLAARGLAPPLNTASLPTLPSVEFISLAAKRLSRPAGTLLRLLHDSDLRGSSDHTLRNGIVAGPGAILYGGLSTYPRDIE